MDRRRTGGCLKNASRTQVHACGMMSVLEDSTYISVHSLSEEEISDQELQQHQIVRYNDLWVIACNPWSEASASLKPCPDVSLEPSRLLVIPHA